MKIAIIDGNGLAFRIYSQFKESKSGLLRNSFGVPTTVIFGILRTLNMLVSKTSFDRVVICWDVSGSYYRREIFPLYKKHRKYIDMKDYFEELDTARKYLDKFGINQCIAKGIEADDVIGYLAVNLRRKDNKIVIVSDDKDFYQVVRNGIKIYRPIKDEFVNGFEVRQRTGLSPRELPKLKALTGEDGDFIPGVCDIDEKNIKLIKCGLGEANAIKILRCGETLRDAIDNCNIEKWKDRLKTKRKQILISYKLARIRTDIDDYNTEEKILLSPLVDKSTKQNNPNVKSVIALNNDLELKTVNIVRTLRNLGIELKGKYKGPLEGEIVT